MSNSPLVTYTKLSPNHSGKRNHIIDTVSIHCYVGQVTAERGCNAGHFVNYDPKNGSSCNYVVGYDGSIGLCVEECNRTWCTSNKENDNRAITIEVASDSTAPYAVTKAAYDALINLLVDICRRNNIKKLLWKGDKSLIGHVGQQNMTVHRWFANKSCPGDYLYNRHKEIADAVNNRLVSVTKPAVPAPKPTDVINTKEVEDDENMDVKRFTELYNQMRKDLQDNDAGQYSETARKWAVDTGLIAGGNTTEFNGMWQDILTREQMVTILYRFAQMMGKV